MRQSNHLKVNSEPSELRKRLAKAEEEGALNDARRNWLRALLDNSEETYFLSSRELAKLYSLDIATVVRTIRLLGYKRFGDFSADLRKHFVMQFTPYWAMKTATEENKTPSDHIHRSLDKDLANLTQLRNRLDVDSVLGAATQIRRARRVLIVGIDFAASLATCLDYGLSVIGVVSESPVGTAGNIRHKVRSLKPNDMLIAISFGRCLKETVNAAIEARSIGVTTLGITDSELSPIARHCDGYLLAPVASPTLSASYAAAMSLVQSIIIACAHMKPRRSLQVMRQNEIDRSENDRWYQETSRHGNGSKRPKGK